MHVIGFPAEVDERAARTVAAGVAALGALTATTQWLPLAVVLALGFLARVLTGPRLSVLGRLATQVVVPRLAGPRRPTPGPPKRFAQAIGLTVSTAAAIALGLGAAPVATALLVVLVAFATLEAAAGVCVGCRLFAALMRAGLVPAETCAACADIAARPGRA